MSIGNSWDRRVQKAGAKSSCTRKQITLAVRQDARNSERNKKARGASHGPRK